MVLDLIKKYFFFFSQPGHRTGGNVLNFGVDMSSSTKIDNKKKRYLNF